MWEYDRIDMSEVIGINKTNEWRRCTDCSNYYFLKVSFRFQQKACSGCNDLMPKAMIFTDAVIVSVNGDDYRI